MILALGCRWTVANRIVAATDADYDQIARRTLWDLPLIGILQRDLSCPGGQLV